MGPVFNTSANGLNSHFFNTNPVSVTVKPCDNYCQFSNIRRTKSQNINVSRLVLQLLCPIHWSQMLSWEWKCSWSSADRRCSNYIWVINNFIAYQGTSYIRDFTVPLTWVLEVSAHQEAQSWLYFEATQYYYYGPLGWVSVSGSDVHSAAAPGGCIAADESGSDDEPHGSYATETGCQKLTDWSYTTEKTKGQVMCNIA